MALHVLTYHNERSIKDDKLFSTYLEIPSTMRQIVLLVFLSSLTVTISQRPYNDLRARFAVNPADGFYELPQTTSSPLIANYVQVPVNWSLPVQVYCYPNDPRVCLMYDFNGNIAGAQTSFLFQDVQIATKYNYSDVGGFVYSDIFNIPAWGFRAYFTNPETLTPAGRQNLTEVVEGLWVYLNNTLIQVQRPEPDPSQLTIGPFDRQNCFPRMGQHYFYNINSGVPCNQMVPFYPLYQGGGLVGYGIADFGQASTYQRPWYETPPLQGVNDIISNRPPCLDVFVKAYGIYATHIYFVDHPWNISCPA